MRGNVGALSDWEASEGMLSRPGQSKLEWLPQGCFSPSPSSEHLSSSRAVARVTVTQTQRDRVTVAEGTGVELAVEGPESHKRHQQHTMALLSILLTEHSHSGQLETEISIGSLPCSLDQTAWEDCRAVPATGSGCLDV